MKQGDLLEAAAHTTLCALPLGPGYSDVGVDKTNCLCIVAVDVFVPVDGRRAERDASLFVS